MRKQQLIEEPMHDDAAIREGAMAQLGMEEDADLLSYLADRLSSPVYSVSRSAHDCLVRLSDANAVPLLIGFSGQSPLRSRYHAIDALGELRGDIAREHLIATLMGRLQSHACEESAAETGRSHNGADASRRAKERRSLR